MRAVCARRSITVEQMLSRFARRCDIGRNQPGRLVGGILSGAERRLAGTSIGAAVFTRMLHHALLKGSTRRLAWLPPPYEYEFDKLPIDILSGSERLRIALDASDDQAIDKCFEVDACTWLKTTAPIRIYLTTMAFDRTCETRPLFKLRVRLEYLLENAS